MFCIAKGYESEGIGKVLELNAHSCKIEYFDTPNCRDRATMTLPKSTVFKKTLEPNTRIYYFHNISDEWLVGRVLQDNGDGVEVRFSDKKDIVLNYESLFVRCKKPIERPKEICEICVGGFKFWSEHPRLARCSLLPSLPASF